MKKHNLETTYEVSITEEKIINSTCIRNEGTEKPKCVLCCQVLSNELSKENKLKRHLHSCHPNLKEKNFDFFNERKTR